ncbi:hypothetical protein NDA10_008034 [Ustilago hordei]|nr:hypothetical protein NDA10_008034 [Ustilago hordei]
MLSSKLALILMLTAGGDVDSSSSDIRPPDRLSRRDGGQPGGKPGGFGAGGADPLIHPAAPGGGSGGGSTATSKGGQMHWATDASGMTGAELAKVVPHDFFIGSSVDNGDLKDPLVAPLTKYFPYVTPANSLKMQFIYESENSWHEVQTGVEKVVGKDTIKWKWHTLVWGAEQNKQMMQQSFSKEAMLKTITEFVSTKMCPKYIKEANFWGIDVLNEVFADDGKGFKKNGYFEVIGEEGYKQVLKLVKKECPNHKLIVNDYGMESKNPKSDFVFKTIKQWLAEGVPVDVVGLQFHIGLTNKYEDMLASIKRWTSESIPVVLSEIDIPINLPPSQQDLEKQAQQYGTMMQAALEGGAFGATFWGLMDSHTWFGTQQQADGMGHGKTGAPLLFDAQGKAKPAVAALVDVFKKWGNKPVGIQGGRLSDLGKGGQGSSSSDGSGAGTGTGTGTGTGGDGTGTGTGTGGDGTGTGTGTGGDGTGTGGDGSGAGSGGYGSGAGTGTGGDGTGTGTGSGGYGSGAGTGTGGDGTGTGTGTGGDGTGTGGDGSGAGSGGYGSGAGTGTGGDGTGTGTGTGGDGTGTGTGTGGDGTGSGTGSGGYGSGAGSGGYGSGAGTGGYGSGAGSGGYGSAGSGGYGSGAGSGGDGTGTGSGGYGSGAGSGGDGSGAGSSDPTHKAYDSSSSDADGSGSGAGTGTGTGGDGTGTGTGSGGYGSGAGSGGYGSGAGSSDPTHEAYGGSNSDVDAGPTDTGLTGGKGNPGGDLSKAKGQPGSNGGHSVHDIYGTPKHRRSMALLRRRL